MCMHCEAITKDVAHRPIVHAFMEVVAQRFGEQYGLDLGPDDIKVTFEVASSGWRQRPRPRGDS